MKTKKNNRTDKKDEIADVIIIGAGMAGLSAAAELSRAGKKIIVCEGRDRFGGRIDTIYNTGFLTPIERGAEFVHELEEPYNQLLETANVTLLDGEGKFVRIQEEGKYSDKDLWTYVEKTLSAIPIPKKDCSMASVLPAYTSETAPLWQYIEGFNAAPASDLSAIAILQSYREEMESGGHKNLRIRPGYSNLIKKLLAEISRERCTLYTSAIVHEVAWKKARVEVSVRRPQGDLRLKGKVVLITIPANILANTNGTAAIAFSPEIPGKRFEAAKVGMGSVVKVIVKLGASECQPLLYRLRPEFSQVSFFRLSGAFPTCWTKWPESSSLLTLWAGGPAAEELSNRDPSYVYQKANQALASILNKSVDEVVKLIEQAWICDWQSDPFSQGAYSYPRVGHKTIGEKLALPIDDTLYFAGEATDTSGVGGTVGSAYRSGLRAAREILHSLRSR